jgi:predicted transcriptional regulator
MIYNKINQFMQKTGKSFSTQTLSKRLNLNEDTTGKYLRRLFFAGELSRTWTKSKNKSCYRYQAV